MADQAKPGRPILPNNQPKQEAVSANTQPPAEEKAVEETSLENQPNALNGSEPLTSAQLQELAAQAGPDYDPNAVLRQAATTREQQAAEDAAIRRESQPKEMRGFDQVSPAARLARRTADVAEKPIEPIFMFISPYKELRLYVNFGHVERERTGATVPRHYAIQFRNGVFTTKNEALAKKMREHPRYGSKTFREELNAQAVAVRAAASAARDNMRVATYAGPSTSGDGAEGVFHHHDHELANVENRLFEL